MTPLVQVLSSEDSVKDAVQSLLEWGISGAAVLEGDQAVGVFSISDLAALVSVGGRSVDESKVKDVMSPWIIKVHPDTPLRRAEALFKRHKVHRLIVMWQTSGGSPYPARPGFKSVSRIDRRQRVRTFSTILRTLRSSVRSATLSRGTHSSSIWSDSGVRMAAGSVVKRKRRS